MGIYCHQGEVGSHTNLIQRYSEGKEKYNEKILVSACAYSTAFVSST